MEIERKNYFNKFSDVKKTANKKDKIKIALKILETWPQIILKIFPKIQKILKLGKNSPEAFFGSGGGGHFCIVLRDFCIF